MAKPLNYSENDESLLLTNDPIPEVKPEILSIQNATVFADGSVFVKPFRVLAESLRAPEMLKVYSLKRCLKQLFYKKRSGRSERVYISVADHWGFEFYHWFADALPRLLLVLKKYNLSNQAVILSNKHRTDYIEDSLKRLGITNVIYLDRKEKIVCPELVLPTFTAANGFHNSALLKEIKALYHINTEPRRRIYITRRSARFRKIVNEFEVILVLQKYGFEIIEMELISFNDKIKMMNETSHLVSIYGAGLTNSLFMHAGTHVVELRKDTLGKSVDHKAKKIVEEKILFQNTYYRMCEATEIHYAYLLCESPHPEQNAFYADLIVDVEKLDALMQTLFSAKPLA